MKHIKAGNTPEKKTEKITKMYRLTDRQGRVTLLECMDYAEALDLSKKQLIMKGRVYPKDMTSLEEV